MTASATMRMGDVFRAIERMKRDVSDAVFVAAGEAVSRFHRNFAIKRLSSRGSESIDSRRIRRALKSETARVGEGLIRGKVWFRGHWEPVARIHETGGIIRARRVKYLTIPLRAAKAKRTARGNVLRATRWPNTFVARSRSGKLFIWQRNKPPKPGPRSHRRRRGRRTTPGAYATPLFLLKKSVRIPARIHFYADWKVWHPKAISLIEDARDGAIRKARF